MSLILNLFPLSSLCGIKREMPRRWQEGVPEIGGTCEPQGQEEHVSPRDPNERVWQEQRKQDLVCLLRGL